MYTKFYDPDEYSVAQSFLENGYTIIPIEEIETLNALKSRFFNWAQAKTSCKINDNMDDFFNNCHEFVSINKLNEFRVNLIKEMTRDPELRSYIYKISKKYIHWIVGNELSMQRSVNLSIQYPKDSSSLLPLHSDVWSGNSPYEVVFWLPLVDCFKTKSMFILPIKKSNELYMNFDMYMHCSAEELYKKIEHDLIWLNVPYGHAIIFSHSLLHGNRINQEEQTRWSLNCRFKSLLSPHGTKELGESFLPITIRPATRLGSSYVRPRTPSV